jgi:hypothetical protein
VSPARQELNISIQFRRASVFTFVVILLLSEGQAGEDGESSTKAMLFFHGAMYRKVFSKQFSKS